jgi:hypothetical protein
MHIRDIQIAMKLIWETVPNPVLAMHALVFILERLAIYILGLVPRAMRAALQHIVQAAASHANMDDGVNLVAVVLVLPKRRVQRPDGLVVNSDGLWVDDDADGRQRSGIGVGGVGVLALQRR